MLKEKIKHHTRGWQVVVSIFFMLAFAPLWFEHLHQYTAPTSDYYLYDEDDPVKVV